MPGYNHGPSPKPQLSSQIHQALFPQSVDVDDQLLGQPVRYCNAAGEVKECTVLDYGTSRLSGKWYQVVLTGPEGSEEKEFNTTDMDMVLAQRISE